MLYTGNKNYLPTNSNKIFCQVVVAVKRHLHIFTMKCAALKAGWLSLETIKCAFHKINFIFSHPLGVFWKNIPYLLHAPALTLKLSVLWNSFLLLLYGHHHKWSIILFENTQRKSWNTKVFRYFSLLLRTKWKLGGPSYEERTRQQWLQNLAISLIFRKHLTSMQ